MMLTGTCYCGAVKITAEGEPAVKAICHCKVRSHARPPLHLRAHDRGSTAAFASDRKP